MISNSDTDRLAGVKYNFQGNPNATILPTKTFRPGFRLKDFAANFYI